MNLLDRYLSKGTVFRRRWGSGPGAYATLVSLTVGVPGGARGTLQRHGSRRFFDGGYIDGGPIVDVNLDCLGDSDWIPVPPRSRIRTKHARVWKVH